MNLLLDEYNEYFSWFITVTVNLYRIFRLQGQNAKSTIILFLSFSHCKQTMHIYLINGSWHKYMYWYLVKVLPSQK